MKQGFLAAPPRRMQALRLHHREMPNSLACDKQPSRSKTGKLNMRNKKNHTIDDADFVYHVALRMPTFIPHISVDFHELL